jgi:hypothetical protein
VRDWLQALVEYVLVFTAMIEVGSCGVLIDRKLEPSDNHMILSIYFWRVIIKPILSGYICIPLLNIPVRIAFR